MSRLLAQGVAGASRAFLTLLALSLAVTGLWSCPAAAVFVAFAVCLDLITFRYYLRTRVLLRLQRRGHGQRHVELAAAFCMVLLFFVLAFVQGADEGAGQVDLKAMACLGLMFGLFLARLVFGGNRAAPGYRRINPDDYEPLPDIMMETRWGVLALLLLFPLLVLPARLQRATLNLIGYGLGFAVTHGAFRLIVEGKPGLATVGLLLALVAAIAFCAILVPIFARNPLLVPRRRL